MRPLSIFLRRQIDTIRIEGRQAVSRKVKRLVLFIPYLLVSVMLAFPIVIVIRAIRPWYLVRIGMLIKDRIGHLAIEPEIFLCKNEMGIDCPKKNHFDLFFFFGGDACNRQLVDMWRRVLRIWPGWLLVPVYRVNRLLPGGKPHEIERNARDANGVLELCSPHLVFTEEEEAKGEARLREMGIPPEGRFVCLLVRDSVYLPNSSYHDYRNSDIRNYALCAQTLADHGYHVIRMGAKVHKSLECTHPRVIDYATNGMRSEFMDIYLGSKCEFCISTGAGWDAVPDVFRRPIVYVGFMPLGYLLTSSERTISITKHHYWKESRKELGLREIIESGIGFSLTTDEYESRGVELVENTPEEIRDVAMEMVKRLDGTWQPEEIDNVLQSRFWELFPSDAKNLRGVPLHGEIRSRFGADFLRKNRDWLQ